MISILIPVFNRNVVELILSIQEQLATVKEEVEVIVMDDASDDDIIKAQNREGLACFRYLRYIELPVNCGRNIIRQKLAGEAKSDTLIFLDADSRFPDKNWLQNYIDAFTGNEIIMGGRRYDKNKRPTSSLHFHYGIQREQHSALQRNKYPYRSFMTCNFLIRKQHLSQLIVDDNLKGYGHEDTFMGLQFEKLRIPLVHIDNPVFHEGVEEDDVFISKQQQGLHNLLYLYDTYQKRYDFSAIKLVRIYKEIAAIPAGTFVLNLLASKKDSCLRIMLRSRRLLWLDLWKLINWHILSKA